MERNEMKKILATVSSLTLIAAVCAAVLAFVNSATKDRIAEAKTRAELEAASAVMPAGVAKVERIPARGGGEGGPALSLFAGYGADGRPAGYAAAGRDGGGYGGDIELMVGFEKDAKTVVCYRKLAAAETPGLGMNLVQPEFAGQFKGRDARALKVKKDGGDIEAISAATITSRAVCRAIADAQRSLAAALD